VAKHEFTISIYDQPTSGAAPKSGLYHVTSTANTNRAIRFVHNYDEFIVSVQDKTSFPTLAYRKRSATVLDQQ
jgi:hypothetical protein